MVCMTVCLAGEMTKYCSWANLVMLAGTVVTLTLNAQLSGHHVKGSHFYDVLYITKQYKIVSIFLYFFRPNCFQIVVQHFSEEQYIFYFAGEAPEQAQVTVIRVETPVHIKLVLHVLNEGCAMLQLSYLSKENVYSSIRYRRPTR